MGPRGAERRPGPSSSRPPSPLTPTPTPSLPCPHSQYVYLSSQLGPDCPTVSWAAFCRDPYVLGDVCAASAADGKPCCRVSPAHQYALAAPQADCFATAQGLPAVDFLGRVENLDADFAALIGVLNARRGVPRLPPPARLRRVNFHNATCTPAPAAAAAAAAAAEDAQPQAAAEPQQPQQDAAKQEEQKAAKQEQPQQQQEQEQQEQAEAKQPQQEAKPEQQPQEAKPEEQQPQQEAKPEQQPQEAKPEEQPQQEAKPEEQQPQEAKPEEQPQQEAKPEQQPQQEAKPEGGGRRLAGEPEPWRARAGTFLPCDPQAYFSGEHARCAADLLSFYARDAEFFQALAFREARNGLL